MARSATLMSRPATRYFVGLGLPLVGVLGLIPVVAQVHLEFAGMPFILNWIFAWYLLTTVCLAACWCLYDRDRREGDAG